MIKYTFVFLLGIILHLFAQTDSLNILWNKNPETDMFRYVLQRSVNSTSNYQNYLNLAYPDTHAVDKDIQPGNLYAYQVAAMDSAGNLSGFSDPDFVGIPIINWTASYIVTGHDSFFTYTSFLSDPDDQVNNLQISISQENNVIVSLQNNGIQISPLDSNYIGPASFILRAEDSDGLYDLKLAQFNYYDTNLQNTPPHLVNLPDTILIGNDSSLTLNLVEFFIDSTNNINEVNWEFDPGPNISYLFNSSTYQLLIIPEANWSGISSLKIRVSDPSQLFDEKNIVINVEGAVTPRTTNEILVYPNPVVYQKGESKVFFENLPGETKKIKIYNLLGQKVFEEKIQNSLDSPFSLNAFNGQPLNLASGVYIYFIETAKEVNNKTGKFFVIK